MFKVLSLDGGGIRGIYSAAFLNTFRKDGTLCDNFDLVIGTSTGAIIALAVAYRIPMEDVVNLYKSNGGKIFGKKHFHSLRGFFDAKYENHSLIKELAKTFGTTRKFLDPSCRVCIQTYNLLTGEPKIFRASRLEETDGLDGRYTIWQVAAASAAAPIFFPTFTAKCGTSTLGIFVDGGIWANNPSILGISEALRVMSPPNLAEIRVLSLGTGSSTFGSSKPRSGLMSWGRDLVEMMLHSQSTATEDLFRRCQKVLDYKESDRITFSVQASTNLDSTDKIDELVAQAERDASHYFSVVKNRFFQ
jgi:patatin-like phospholipase/acyl hydrolase